MLDTIKEIQKVLDNKCYLAALTLSLTLPDICSQVENGVMDGNRSKLVQFAC